MNVPMNVTSTMSALEKLGSEPTKKQWLRHGAKGELFGVKVADMKALMKKLPKEPKERQALALGLYATKNLDAMYLAGLLGDGALMSRKELGSWAAAATSAMVSEYTVPWVAAESPFGRELALEWMDSKKPSIACSGWSTYASMLQVRPDAELDFDEIGRLLARVEKEIGKAPDRVRYCMNGFVIAVGAGVKPLLAKAKATAKKIGTVEVDVGDTACEVPVALERIAKIETMGKVGKKRATFKC